MEDKIKIVGGPEIEEREACSEKYLEITWELNRTPDESWDKKFESLLKSWLEKENNLFGPYKPKIIFTQFITTLLSKDDLEKQRKFFEVNFIDVINKTHISELL